MTPLRIAAVYMRGGTSKGVFFRAPDLPRDAAERDVMSRSARRLMEGWVRVPGA
jgi:2-methylaconitate cis-trans-isomerase PrpF